jgi:hypothetical protein
LYRHLAADDVAARKPAAQHSGSRGVTSTVVPRIPYRAGLALVLTTLALAPLAAGADAELKHGVVSQAPLAPKDFARMDRGGVETLRFLVRWRLVEPSAGGYDWSRVDPVVEGAARHGVELLPFVYGSPQWVDAIESHPPLDTRADRAAWRGFLTALVERYGPHGEFWRGPGKAHPIRRWQIWNEPNFDFYWDPAPSAREYARLVEISAAAIRGADRRSEIMLGGVASVHNGVPWWRFLRQVYERPGIRRDFDTVALHPYSPGIYFLGKQIRLAREVMREAGDRRAPLAVTEIGWASDGDRGTPLVVGETGQANILRRSFDYLEQHRREWRISDVDWYAWQDSPAVEAFCSFCEHAGLFDLDGNAKPAWRAFQRAVG